MTVGVDNGFDRALQHHRAGRVEDAEPLYREVLRKQPDHHQALYLTSLISMQAGRYPEAQALLLRAVDLAADNPVYLTNLGEVYRRQGKLEDAVQVLVRAVALKPDLAEPSYNLGLVLTAMGDKEAAIPCFERAVDVSPESFPAQVCLAALLGDVGQHARAVAHFQCALALRPNDVGVLSDLAEVLRNAGRGEGAVAMAVRVRSLKPDSARAYHTIGGCLLDQERLDDAIVHLEKAVALDPKLFNALFDLANAYSYAGLLDAAMDGYRKALAEDPESTRGRNNLVWTFAFHPDHDAKSLLAEARRWDEQHGAPLARYIRPHLNDRTPERRLRVGYVSPDFRENCQALFMVPLLSHHDHSEFEIHCYSCVKRPDKVTERLSAYASRWHEVATLSSAALADRIHSDQIDVLVDLTMHMQDSRLTMFARKPAPVQICWLAYPGTTGLSAMDYRVTDRYLDPDGSTDPYAERSLVLPDTFWCYDPLTDQPDVNPLPALSTGRITFGCLNNFMKINDLLIGLWARVLQAIPTSRMIVLAPEGLSRTRTLDVFVKAGIDPRRVELVGRRPRLEYLAAYHEIDVCLDTLPYNGHTTTLDALWMGVPVVSLVGSTIVGRAGLSMATNLGMPEMIATTEEQFVEKASSLVGDLERLAEMRSKLRARMQESPLMDAPRFAKNLESAYRDAWRAWCVQGNGGVPEVRRNSRS